METPKEYSARPYGVPLEIVPLITRLIAPNPKALTLRGTNSHIVGDGEIAVVDPGPAHPRHVKALLDVIDDRPVKYIFVTHSHIDHCGAAGALAQATGAEIVGFGALPHFTPRDSIERDYDAVFMPTVTSNCGEIFEFGDHRVEAVHTPGHFPNHLCYALDDGRVLFSGDHVLGGSSTLIAPPLGSMNEYLASLIKLLDRADELYLPGHGPMIADPKDYLRHMLAHRDQREAQILRCLKDGVSNIQTIAGRIYRGLEPHLRLAAEKSVAAHLAYLRERGIIGHGKYAHISKLSSEGAAG